ncbi:MAG TPA: hypothetical protein IAB87_04205 [Candidatus Coprenecus merdipullorum]|nr:hypothetical protein [Candidatus Coprenecus merdipullorum]
MKRIFFPFGVALCALFVVAVSRCTSDVEPDSYAVLAPAAFAGEAEAWEGVVSSLQQRHDAVVLRFEESPMELEARLKELAPRYVAVVDVPENIGRDYVISLNQMSRRMDEDPYADFLWGIITGYDAAGAQRMVDDAQEPMVIRTGVASIKELEAAKWFDAYAFVDDHQVGMRGEKKSGESSLTYSEIEYRTDMAGANEHIQKFVEKRFGKDVPDVLRQFLEYYEGYEPDLVVTASHATENNLEMPGSVGNLRCRDGRLYVDYPGEQRFVEDRDSRMVYLPIGNCLIGNMNNTRNSMAAAWMNSQKAATFVGYVVTTWYGRNGWGGLKYLITNPGRYSVPEAFYMNQQDMMAQMAECSDSLTVTPFDYDSNYFQTMMPVLQRFVDMEGLSQQEMINELFFWLGFWHDRDVLAYYGDPKWNVRMQEVEGESDFTVTSEFERLSRDEAAATGASRRCVITVETSPDFSLRRMQGDGFKEEHVLDLPFSYFFPQRLSNPVLPEGETRHIVLDENFLLLYDPAFEPGQTYTFEVLCD